MLAVVMESISPIGAPLSELLPLGSALICLLDENPLRALAEVAYVRQQSPWCPVVIATDEPIMVGSLHPLRDCLGNCVVVAYSQGGALPAVDAIRGAIGKRGVISSPTGLVEYVRRRATEAVANAVNECIGGAGHWTPGLRRRLGRLHLPSPQHWLNLFTLTKYLAAAAYPRHRTLEQVALEHNRAPRTLSSWCARYLRCSWPEAQRRLGWERAVEVFLRAYRCCPASPPPPIKALARDTGGSAHVFVLSPGSRVDGHPA